MGEEYTDVWPSLRSLWKRAARAREQDALEPPPSTESIMLAYLESESEEAASPVINDEDQAREENWKVKEGAKRAVDAALAKFTRNLVASIPQNQERA